MKITLKICTTKVVRLSIWLYVYTYIRELWVTGKTSKKSKGIIAYPLTPVMLQYYKKKRVPGLFLGRGCHGATHLSKDRTPNGIAYSYLTLMFVSCQVVICYKWHK